MARTATAAAGCLLLLAGLTSLDAGQLQLALGFPPQGNDGRAADRQAIERAARDFVAAFDKGDAKAVAAGWTERAEFTDDQGVSLHGRAQIEAVYSQLFKEQPKSKLELEIGEIRFLSRDVAVEEGVLRITRLGPELPVVSRYSAIHVREEGRWLTAMCREWGSQDAKLADLAWLAGTWKSADKDRERTLTFTFNVPKTVIENRYMVREQGQETNSGVRTIGFDPRSARLISTTVDDDGGRGESIWHRDDNRWVMDSTGVLADGSETAATDILTRISADEFVWSSSDRAVNGQPAADAAPVKLIRVKTTK